MTSTYQETYPQSGAEDRGEEDAPQAGEMDEDDEEENVFYENPEEVIREFGNNPLMDRGQKALLEQYKETLYRQQIISLEKKEELKKLTSEREAIGVQLYALQQQLARIQLMLENAHNEYNSIVDIRLSEEELLKDVSKNNSEQSALYEEYTKQQKKHNQELEALTETIRQIEVYNQQVQSEILISKRAAYKVEQNMQILEKEKEHQDKYVDNLSKQINSLEENVSFMMKQYELQSQDTNDAAQVLQDTLNELELISTEKQQLMMQWKAALSGLSRRDEALAQATQTLLLAESAVHDYDVEIEATRREIQREQARHESLVNLRDRMENELSWVEENLTKIRNERTALQERYTLLNKSLQQTENDSKKLELITKGLNHDNDAVITNLQIVTQERQKMEEEYTMLLSTYSNVNKAVMNLDKDSSKLLKLIHEKENESSEIENEIAHSVMQRLQVMNMNENLKEHVNIAIKEVKEKESLASKYQLEIRQRNDEIEKKMYRVDRLNKKYEKMLESVGRGQGGGSGTGGGKDGLEENEENLLGPLENTIKNLQKEIDNMQGECSELEREWLRRQTEMVHMSSDCEVLHEQTNEQQARVTVLTQQQYRVTKELRELQMKLKAAQHIHGEYNKDVSKLNGLISENHEQEVQLQASNFIVEMDCVEELKDAEKQCVQIMTSISEAKSAKGSLLEEMVNMERQAMLWEKKIQLDKETRQALDPSIGKAENENMEKEIHRMALRLEALKREQERLSLEMVRAIEKRATISTRYSTNSGSASAGGGAGGGSGKGGGMTSASATMLAGSTNKNLVKDLTVAAAKKRIGILKKESRVLAEEISSYGNTYEQKKQQLSDMTVALEQRTAEYGEAEETCHQLQSMINDLLYQKQLMQERVSYRQKFCTRLREVSQQGVELGQALTVERKLLSSMQALDNVKEIIQELQSSFPHLKEVLERVLAMTDPGIDELVPGGGNGSGLLPPQQPYEEQ